MRELIIGILIPFLGTTLGAAMVFLMRKEINRKLEKFLLGFAGGVMIAASVWSLLIPSIEQSKNVLPALIGFAVGIIFLFALDKIIPHLHYKSIEPEGVKSKFKKITMLTLAVTLHNIPEGMAVGVVLAAAYYGNSIITMSGAIALAIGIAIQNFPEGAIISMPLKGEGVSKKKAFLLGTLSGLVEPIAAIITILLTSYVTSILPYFLSFAAGAMIYVVVEELIPEGAEGKHSDFCTIGFAIGFAVMMTLDVVLG